MASDEIAFAADRLMVSLASSVTQLNNTQDCRAIVAASRKTSRFDPPPTIYLRDLGARRNYASGDSPANFTTRVRSAIVGASTTDDFQSPGKRMATEDGRLPDPSLGGLAQAVEAALRQTPDVLFLVVTMSGSTMQHELQPLLKLCPSTKIYVFDFGTLGHNPSKSNWMMKLASGSGGRFQRL